MNTKLNKIFTAFLIVLIALGSFTGCSENKETSGENADKHKKEYSNIIENPNIAIPGYESLEFKAGKKKQSVNFYNPEENTCYFRISLVLKVDDGTGSDKASGDDKEKEAEETSAPEETAEADKAEEALWTSELIEPGEEIKSIELDKELESGEYPAILKYECFSLKDETPLNGSNVELVLSVK